MYWTLTLSGSAPDDATASIDDLFESFQQGVEAAGHTVTGGAISSTRQVQPLERKPAGASA